MLPLVALSDDHGATTIKFPSDLPSYAETARWVANYTALGIDTHYLSNATINTIDGLEVWDWINTVGVPNAGSYQDPQLRLSSLFASYAGGYAGGYAVRVLGSFAQTTRMPDSDTINITATATDGKNVEVAVPWYTRYLWGDLGASTGVEL